MNLGIYGDHERQKYSKNLQLGNQEMHVNEMADE